MSKALFRAAAVALALITASLPATALPAKAGETLVAVAANFTAAATEIGEAFTQATGHAVKYSFGPTGQLYTQIAKGAPFEVFLAADAERPALAEGSGHAVPGSRFTYAVGKLVLWSADPALIDGTGAILGTGTFKKLAIANPATAPYGAAALDVLAALGLAEALAPKIVQGASISQAHQFVATGNAQVGFVALAQVVFDDGGSRWVVPEDLYAPIVQDAVLVRDTEAARAYLNFLRSPDARRIIQRHGYGLASGS